MESNREIPMVVGENGKFVIDDVLDRMDYINTQIAADFSVFSKTVLRMIGYPLASESIGAIERFLEAHLEYEEDRAYKISHMIYCRPEIYPEVITVFSVARRLM